MNLSAGQNDVNALRGGGSYSCFYFNRLLAKTMLMRSVVYVIAVYSIQKWSNVLMLFDVVLYFRRRDHVCDCMGWSFAHGALFQRIAR